MEVVVPTSCGTGARPAVVRTAAINAMAESLPVEACFVIESMFSRAWPMPLNGKYNDAVVYVAERGREWVSESKCADDAEPFRVAARLLCDTTCKQSGSFERGAVLQHTVECVELRSLVGGAETAASRNTASGDKGEVDTHTHLLEDAPRAEQFLGEGRKAVHIARCEKCGEREKIKKWSKQTRSGDEGETAFFKCLVCGESWSRSS